MNGVLASSPHPALLGAAPRAGAPLAANLQAALAAPPELGSLPTGARGRALLCSSAVYGGLLASAVAVAMAAPVQARPVRTMAVVLETFDSAGGPPPPPAGGAPRASEPSRSLEAAPATETAEVTPPVQVPELTPSQLPSSASPQASAGLGGRPGGIPGGQVGGVLGGTPGATPGGQGDAVVAPRFDAAYLQNPEPDYPLLSKRLGEEGRVLLRVLVSADGLAEQVELRTSSGHPRLDQAALTTVRRWRFAPARRGVERLAAWVLVPLSFQLDA